LGVLDDIARTASSPVRWEIQGLSSNRLATGPLVPFTSTTPEATVTLTETVGQTVDKLL